MIELIPVRIAPASEQKLRRWLAQPEADTLRLVVAARCQFLQAEALGKALQATAGESSDLLQQDAMKQAAKFDTVNQILQELIEQPKETPFQIAKLKTNIYADTNTNTNTDGPEEA